MRPRLALLAILLVAACAPRLQPPGEAAMVPLIAPGADTWRAGDGRELPLRVWTTTQTPRAVVLALHGFNDYSNAFAEAADWWAARGVVTYAPDQRGFGRAPYRGLWPGETRLADDLAELSGLVRARHPNLPVYWLGESMGGAVVLHALKRGGARPDGAVLVAPAVWGRATMPVHYRMALWLTSYTIPWQTFTGRGLKIQASDNIDMLRRLGRDPLFIKETRVDAIHGIVNLMDQAALARPTNTPLLLLYGARDEVIPRPPVAAFVQALQATPGLGMRLAVYDNGWHMLLRDLEAEVVWRDILAWMVDRTAALPSGRERAGPEFFADTNAAGRQ